jgi:hypothetical protein
MLEAVECSACAVCRQSENTFRFAAGPFDLCQDILGRWPNRFIGTRECLFALEK